MKRISRSWPLLLFAGLIAGGLAFAASVSDSDLVDKDLSLIERAIIEEILNSRRSKSTENSWYEMMNRNTFWNPWLTALTAGMACACPCSGANTPFLPPPTMGTAQLPVFSNPLYAVNSRYRYPSSELSPDAVPSPSSAYYPNQAAEIQTRMLSDHPPPLVHHQQPATPAEESVQQKGLIQAIRSRFKAEIAAIAAKINPSEPSPPAATTGQQSTTAPPTFNARQSSPSQRSPAAQQQSSAAHQQSRSSTKTSPRR